MGKVTVKTNFRVEVEPDEPWLFGKSQNQAEWEKAMREACEDIKAQIHRHVDGLPRFGGVVIQWDSDNVCGYCGAAWTEDDDVHNGGCCSKDEETAPDQQVVA